MRRRDLTLGAKCLLGRLKRYAFKTGKCYPSLPTLASELGTSVDSVKRFRAQLTEADLISVAKVGRGSGNSTNYVLHDTPEKGAETPPKETIVGRKKQEKRQDPPAVKVNGFPSESDRRKKTTDYQATLADGEAFVKLMFDAIGKTEKVDTALRWLRLARRAKGWWDIERVLREKMSSNPPRSNAWFKTVLENQFGLSPGDTASQKSDFIERYRKATRENKYLEAMQCAEEAAKAGIPTTVLMGAI